MLPSVVFGVVSSTEPEWVVCQRSFSLTCCTVYSRFCRRLQPRSLYSFYLRGTSFHWHGYHALLPECHVRYPWLIGGTRFNSAHADDRPQFCEVFAMVCHLQPSRGSSVSTVSDYGLDGRGRSPTEAEDFSSSLCVQTGSGAHPASYTMGTGGCYPRVKHGRGVMLTTHPLLSPRLRKCRSYTSSHPKAPLWSVKGTIYLFFLPLTASQWPCVRAFYAKFFVYYSSHIQGRNILGLSYCCSRSEEV
jgi:hypothetical protein